jgi:hypothetical protein
VAAGAFDFPAGRYDNRVPLAMSTAPLNAIRPGSIIRGPTLPEPVEVLAVVPLGDALKVIGRGLNTGLTHDPVLTSEQLAQLTVSAEQEKFDGDARLFRLGVEAHRLGLAFEYDPFFSLSIARVDPGPDRPRRQPDPLPRNHGKCPRGTGQEGTEPFRDRRQVGRGQGAPAGARGGLPDSGGPG